MPPPDPTDPDAHNLPPGARLPDRLAYKRGQLRAMTVTNFVVLLVLLSWWWLDPASREALICAALAAILLFINLTRWLLARRA